jgi:hypothetical protein
VIRETRNRPGPCRGGSLLSHCGEVLLIGLTSIFIDRADEQSSPTRDSLASVKEDIRAVFVHGFLHSRASPLRYFPIV